MKILVIQTAFIGDVILATPIVESLKLSLPNAKIDFLLRKGNESLLSNNTNISEVIIFDKKKKYQNLFKLIQSIRSRSYDYVINAQRHFTTGLITTLSGAEKTIGFDKNPLSFCFTEKIKYTLSKENNTHEVSRNLSLISSITEKAVKKPCLYPSEQDFNSIKKDHEYLCIAPSSVWFTKQFPRDKWCELIDQIPSAYKVYLLGGPDDIELCKDIKSKSSNPNTEVLAGSLSFLQSAALMKGAKMNFSNDSAPLHLASAMNAPITVFFCSTVPEFGFGPLSDVSYIIETKESLKCRPCGVHGKKECPKEHFKCATNINIADVLERLKL